jgi:hypothetical protein
MLLTIKRVRWRAFASDSGAVLVLLYWTSIIDWVRLSDESLSVMRLNAWLMLLQASSRINRSRAKRVSSIILADAIALRLEDNVRRACVANIKPVECVGVVTVDPCLIIRHARCPPRLAKRGAT